MFRRKRPVFTPILQVRLDLIECGSRRIEGIELVGTADEVHRALASITGEVAEYSILSLPVLSPGEAPAAPDPELPDTE
jgi:hypothetical protein